MEFCSRKGRNGAEYHPPKCVKDPHLSRRKDGSFAITARRVEEDGSEDEESRGKVLLWLTEDFIRITGKRTGGGKRT